MMKPVKWSILLPAIMLVYLGFMAYVGYPHLQAGEYLFYFGVVGISILIIVALHFVLRKKEQKHQKASEDVYGTYADVEAKDHKSGNNGDAAE